MARQMIWLSYDLGVRGDYAGLYDWLDTHGAKECGDSVAAINFAYEGSLPEAILADLRGNVEFTSRTRFYLIYRDDSTGQEKGRFLTGRRRASAWTGYAADGETADDELVS